MSVPSASGTSPGRHRHRRARTRSARNQIAAHRIARDAVGRAHADQAGGELVEVGLADDDGAGRAQPCDTPSRRAPACRRTPGRRRWWAGRRRRYCPSPRPERRTAASCAGILFGQRLGFRHRFLLVAQADEDRGIVVVANPLKAARDGLRGRHRRRRDARRRFRRRFQSRAAPIGNELILRVRQGASPDAKREGKRCRVSPARRIPQPPAHRPARRRALPPIRRRCRPPRRA